MPARLLPYLLLQVWLTLTTAFQADSGVQPPANLPGRIAYITFAFCMLVLLSLFTANTGEPRLPHLPALLSGGLACTVWCSCRSHRMPLLLGPPAASIVTTMRLSSSINGRGDLAGKAVGVWEGYSHLLDNTEIRAVPLPWCACGADTMACTCSLHLARAHLCCKCMLPLVGKTTRTCRR